MLADVLTCVLTFAATAIEGVAGILFIGNIGAGFGAVIGLILFGLSIFGVEWGVKFALRAGDQELPPAIQLQLDNLLANDGKDDTCLGVKSRRENIFHRGLIRPESL